MGPGPSRSPDNSLDVLLQPFHFSAGAMKLLAIDTSTETLSVAVQAGLGEAARVFSHQAVGGAHASAQLIGVVQALLREAGVPLRELDAIAYGAGPGAFTGLRTACAVAQGLGFGAGVPLLPVNTLLAVAEEARLSAQRPLAQPDASWQVLTLLDARMGEVYAAHAHWDGRHWATLDDVQVVPPEQVRALYRGSWPDALAGNALTAYGAQLLPELLALPRIAAAPTATALLRLAPALRAAGAAVPAHEAGLHYIRDKVAQTTAEREAARRTVSENSHGAAD